MGGKIRLNKFFSNCHSEALQIGERFKIRKTKLILVEGKDELNFFTKFLEFLNLGETVDVWCVNGKDNFRKIINLVKKDEMYRAGKLEMLGIIRDADKDFDGAFKSVCTSLNNNGFPFPEKAGTFIEETPKIGIYILPDNNSPGQLEDLCLKSIMGKEVYKCVNEYYQCIKTTLQKTGEKVPQDESKSMIQAYLASLPELCEHIGIAAQKDYWDFNSSAFEDLFRFLLCFKGNDRKID
ncbi:MAG: DUF3226 domain-containing protein [Thermoplasmata archaeon]